MSHTTPTQQREGAITDSTRMMQGFLWGAAATVLMSIPMVIGMLTGAAPMPKPIPVAIIGTLLGEGLPRPLLMLLAIGSHLAYGGIFGTLLASIARPITLLKGLGLGIFLWLILGIVVLPLIGWGVFGTAITPAIAVATLVLHVVYGLSFGWLMDRGQGAA